MDSGFVTDPNNDFFYIYFNEKLSLMLVSFPFQMVPHSTLDFVGLELLRGSRTFTAIMLHHGPQLDPEQTFPFLSYGYKERGSHRLDPSLWDPTGHMNIIL
jgi:hypothetical protein